MSNGLRSPRVLVWTAAAVVCMGYYWLRTQPFPRRTPVGVERRLFGIGGSLPVLDESPSGRRVLVGKSWDGAAPTPAPPRTLREWPAWLTEQALLRLNGAPRGSRPALSVLPPEGTWLLEGDRLRYRWRLSGSWMGDKHLWATNINPGLGPEGNWLLDLSTGRTYRGDAAGAKVAELGTGGEVEDVTNYGDADRGPAPMAPALDDLSTGSLGSGMVQYLDERRVSLHSSTDSETTGDLIAATAEEPYLTRVLSPRSALLTVSRNGKTLFLWKSDGLWRLDLRKSVIGLLREVEVPALPLEGVISPAGREGTP